MADKIPVSYPDGGLGKTHCNSLLELIEPEGQNFGISAISFAKDLLIRSKYLGDFNAELCIIF